MISKANIQAARQRIQPYIHRTPVLTSAALDALTGSRLFFKCENFQKVGAFKSRGAMNAALSLPEAALKKGLAAHSSGNHAQALARAGQILNVPAYIVMPDNAPAIKKKAVAGYGGKIYECENNISAREAMLAQVIAETGATEIHPFDNDAVITGQATAATELFEETGALDYLIAPVGGGGLLSGSILAANYFSPATRVIAAEPAGADDAFRSLQSGKIERSQSNTIADGLLTNLSARTFAIIQNGVSAVLTVPDSMIIFAMRQIWERMKLVVEPSAAVPLAVVLQYPEQFAGLRTGILLSGGNVDLDKIGKLFSETSK